ncbi:Uncharacterised protein [Sphingobacterium daejeonense]|nr:Uncharacterised protein [Sphingobacterium daejeonense]
MYIIIINFLFSFNNEMLKTFFDRTHRQNNIQFNLFDFLDSKRATDKICGCKIISVM